MDFTIDKIEKFEVRAFDKSKEENTFLFAKKNWNVYTLIKIKKELFEQVSKELEDKLFDYLSNYKNFNSNQANWDITFGECYEIMKSCPSYKTTLYEFSKQHPELDFSNRAEYHCTLSLYKHLSNKNHLYTKLRNRFKDI